ncbi:hypothetical protein [Maricaulis maris]|uniref:Uncharacterized protein n=1 Tax=Maricaulis maris TaxID=74318 RepID=A0A495DDB9_9PROT|nr:hypothetical protein [Maricaulis maris]RKR00309.1 hypothetical protein C7435_1514 [Maricaulis maris]
MKTALNLFSIVVLGAIAGGIYFGADNPETDPVVVADPGADQLAGDDRAPDPAPVVDSVPDDPLVDEVIDPTANGIVYTVEGTASGYFIATEEIRFGDLVLENIELWPAMPECDEPAYVRLAVEDTSDQLGENEYGPYFRLYAMTIDSASITDDGVMITATDAEIGTLVIEATYVDGALAEWQTGADSVAELLVGTATLNGDTQPASFAFWIGD